VYLTKEGVEKMEVYRRFVPLFAALLIAVAGCKGSSPTTTSGSLAAGEVEAVFQVEGMTCSSCNTAVKLAAEKVNGVRQARASQGEKRAWVHYDPAKTNPEAIATAITSAGYKATPLPAAGPAGPSATQ